MSDAARRAVIATARAMNASGLNSGTSGNVSRRVDDGFLITPSGLRYESLEPSDVVHVTLEGEAAGTHRPSSEWRIHRDVYGARDDVAAIVHAHPVHATALACLPRPLPAFHYMVAVAGGRDVLCARYATFGTQELSDAALAALEGRRACLLANHGMIATGPNLDAALKLAQEVEELAEQFWRVLQIGEPIVLDDAEMDRVLEKFRTYGQPRKA